MRQMRGLFAPLYLIEILHQTTTYEEMKEFYGCCILLKFYIKPQRRVYFAYVFHGCILLKFYIKPQPSALVALAIAVVSY